MQKRFPGTALVTALLAHHGVLAEETPNLIEEIVITGHARDIAPATLQKPGIAMPIDSAALLKSLPGANVNSNGPVSGIVQYRGLYGDRVAVVMDGEGVMSGGPNAMDAPLSYAPPLLLQSLSLTPGIAPVSASQESIGGHVSAAFDRGEFANTSDVELSGALHSRYNSLDAGRSHALRSIAATQRHKLAALAAYDEGNDAESGGGENLVDTGYRRQRYDLSYGWQNDNSTFTLAGGKLETNNSGTPALPMDIIYIDTDIANITGTTTVAGLEIKGHAAYRQVDHVMDNFSLRSNPAPVRYRQTKAIGRQTSWGLSAALPLASGSLTLGLDTTATVHDAFVSNPNMALFGVQNFANAERDIYGLFGEWNRAAGIWQLEAGLRYNHVKTDSDEVFASGMMPMVQNLADQLSRQFNTGTTRQNFDNFDLVTKASRPLNDQLSLHIGLARKTRAPSFQELYLWLPMEAAGGLADGRTYIGNLNLESEKNHEINLGLSWQIERAYLDAQVFYRRVDDFIQGTPSVNMMANMLGTMMSGQAPLQFNNIDAELYGFDGRYGLTLSERWRLDGIVSYVRGEDRDNGDNLYRIAPLNHSLTLSWEKDPVSAHLESVLYAGQSKVSAFNDEQKTSAYGLLNLGGEFRASDALTVSAGIENLLDQDYADHLGGYNRNGDSDVAVGDHLPGRGRNLFIAVKLNW